MTTYTSPQDGTTLDARTASDAATTNFASGDSIYVGEHNAATSVQRSFVRFPGLTDGSIPSGATILSASLFLLIYADYSSNARTFRVYRSKRDVNIGQVTWNIWKAGSNWSTAGGFHADDCEQTDSGSCSLTATDSGWKEFVLSATAIQEIVSGAWTTPTLLIKADTENNDMYIFWSSNAATTTNRPYITVTYILGGQVFIFTGE